MNIWGCLVWLGVILRNIVLCVCIDCLITIVFCLNEKVSRFWFICYEEQINIISFAIPSGTPTYVGDWLTSSGCCVYKAIVCMSIANDAKYNISTFQRLIGR